MELNLNELELIRQALYSKVLRMEQEVNRSYAKTGPSARLDRKGRDIEEFVSVMNKINQQKTNLIVSNW